MGGHFDKFWVDRGEIVGGVTELDHARGTIDLRGKIDRLTHQSDLYRERCSALDRGVRKVLQAMVDSMPAQDQRPGFFGASKAYDAFFANMVRIAESFENCIRDPENDGRPKQ